MTSDATGGVNHALLLDKQPGFIKRKKPTGRFVAGVRYEKEVHEYLVEHTLGRVDLKYLQGPWIEYKLRNSSRMQYCQPDAIILNDKGFGIIVEAKYQHCIEAWVQLTRLYAPVVKVLFPSYQFGLLEIVHWHDPAIRFPEPYDLTNDPLSIRRASHVSVHIFNPKRARLQQDGHSGRSGRSEETSENGLPEGAK